MKTYFDERKPFWGKFILGINPGISNVLVSYINKKVKYKLLLLLKDIMKDTVYL